MGKLYELPEGWEWKKLEEVCQFINGRAYKKVELLSEGKYPVLRVGNFFTNNNWYYSDLELPDNKYCDYGDLLYAWSASFGPRIWKGEKSIYHYHIWKILPDNKLITKEFLYQLLDWDVEKIKSDQGTGTTMMHVTKGSMEARKIPLPPLQEQKRIVAKLDSLFVKIDQAITLHQQNIDEADALMGSLLNEVFEELEEKYPEMRRFDTFTKLSRGHNPPKKDFIYQPKDGYVRFLQIRDGSSDKDAVYVPITKKLHLVTKDDLLLVAYRQVGKVFRNMEGAFNVALCKIENIDSSHLSTTYIYYLIHSKYVKGELLKRAERALIPSMSIEHLKSIKIPIPPLSAQQKTVTYLDQLSQKTEKLKQTQQEKMESLKDLKASLLDKAFRGEL